VSIGCANPQLGSKAGARFHIASVSRGVALFPRCFPGGFSGKSGSGRTGWSGYITPPSELERSRGPVDRAAYCSVLRLKRATAPATSPLRRSLGPRFSGRRGLTLSQHSQTNKRGPIAPLSGERESSRFVRPWEELRTLTDDLEMEQHLFSYYICRARKPPVAVGGARPQAEPVDHRLVAVK
jgi:hypothetical protein